MPLSYLKINSNSLISLTMELNYLKVLFEDVEKAKLKLLVLITMFSELVVRENSLRIVLLCTKLNKPT